MSKHEVLRSQSGDMKIKKFLQYAIHHSVNFHRITGNRMRYCAVVICAECVNSEDGYVCLETGSIDMEDYEIICKEFPEYVM